MTVQAGMPHLDIYTLSEIWALGESAHAMWSDLARSLGVPPSSWIDDDGRRIYAAVIAFAIETDLARPVDEDDAITFCSRLAAVRKPHAVGETTFSADGVPAMTVKILSSFVRRDTPDSNKKFSKVRTLWQAPDHEPAVVNDWLARHHAAKGARLSGAPDLCHEANRLADFNAAHLFYFRNFAQLARAAEWRVGRQEAPRLAMQRDAWFYGNVDDGELIEARVAREGDRTRTELARPDGTLLFLSEAVTRPVEIDVR